VLSSKIIPCHQGRRVPLRFTLAPSFPIARLFALVLASAYRAFGAGIFGLL